MGIYETVKRTVTVRQAAERYGLKINRSGMACCPFHEDRNPSLKLNEDYFYCFGCGAKGDVIDFTARLDDDMKLEALPQTNNIKAIITAELPMDLEKKGKQSYQGDLYVRFLALGNGTLQSLYDRSVGFFRRQIMPAKQVPRPQAGFPNQPTGWATQARQGGAPSDTSEPQAEARRESAPPRRRHATPARVGKTEQQRTGLNEG